MVSRPIQEKFRDKSVLTKELFRFYWNFSMVFAASALRIMEPGTIILPNRIPAKTNLPFFHPFQK